MHTEQSGDPSSSAGTMLAPPLLPLLVVPLADAVTLPEAATSGVIAACSCGGWEVDTMLLAGMWNGRYGLLTLALIFGTPGLARCEECSSAVGEAAKAETFAVLRAMPAPGCEGLACCGGPACCEGPAC